MVNKPNKAINMDAKTLRFFGTGDAGVRDS